MQQPVTSAVQRAVGADVEHNVTVAVTSDKGLCGGINTTVTKYTRGTLATIKEGAEACCSCSSVHHASELSAVPCACWGHLT